MQLDEFDLSTLKDKAKTIGKSAGQAIKGFGGKVADAALMAAGSAEAAGRLDQRQVAKSLYTEYLRHMAGAGKPYTMASVVDFLAQYDIPLGEVTQPTPSIGKMLGRMDKLANDPKNRKQLLQKLDALTDKMANTSKMRPADREKWTKAARALHDKLSGMKTPQAESVAGAVTHALFEKQTIKIGKQNIPLDHVFSKDKLAKLFTHAAQLYIARHGTDALTSPNKKPQPGVAQPNTASGTEQDPATQAANKKAFISSKEFERHAKTVGLTSEKMQWFRSALANHKGNAMALMKTLGQSDQQTLIRLLTAMGSALEPA